MVHVHIRPRLQSPTHSTPNLAPTPSSETAGGTPNLSYPSPPTSLKPANLYAEKPGRSVLDELLGGESHLLQPLGVRSGNVGTSDPLGGSIEVIKGIFHGQGEDFGGDTEGGETGLDGEKSA